jgi:hypothetical protein
VGQIRLFALVGRRGFTLTSRHSPRQSASHSGVGRPAQPLPRHPTVAAERWQARQRERQAREAGQRTAISYQQSEPEVTM